MILNRTNCKTIKGRFFKFTYITRITKQYNSIHFGCFQDNDLEEAVYEYPIFAENADDLFDYIQDLNKKCVGHLSMYHYQMKKKIEGITYSAAEAVEELKSTNPNYMPMFAELGVRQFIF